MKDAVLTELVDLWDLQAATDTQADPNRRETLRECADTLRIIVQTMGEKPPRPDCPHAAPFRFCPTCVEEPCPIGMPNKKLS